MNIKIIALGKLKEKFLKDGIDEFLKRLDIMQALKFIEINPIEVKDENLAAKFWTKKPQKS